MEPWLGFNLCSSGPIGYRNPHSTRAWTKGKCHHSWLCLQNLLLPAQKYCVVYLTPFGFCWFFCYLLLLKFNLEFFLNLLCSKILFWRLENTFCSKSSESLPGFPLLVTKSYYSESIENDFTLIKREISFNINFEFSFLTHDPLNRAFVYQVWEPCLISSSEGSKHELVRECMYHGGRKERLDREGRRSD